MYSPSPWAPTLRQALEGFVGWGVLPVLAWGFAKPKNAGIPVLC